MCYKSFMPAPFIALLAHAIAVVCVAAAVCFQRPDSRHAARVSGCGLCALLVLLGCAVAGVLTPPPVWWGALQVLVVVLAGEFISKCGWRRAVASVGCWAFVSFMLWMALRLLPGNTDALAYAHDKILPAVLLPCFLAFLLSVRSPVRFWSAFMDVFLVLYLMESVRLAWESADPHVILPGPDRLIQQAALGLTELALCAAVFRWVLQCTWRRTLCVLALYSLRTAYVLALLLLAR